MLFNCPLCGNQLEADGVLEEGEQLECPYCEKVFQYSSQQGKNVNFCRDCGAKIPAGAEFCLGCGRDIHTNNGYAHVQVATTESEKKLTLKEQWSNSGPLQKLFAVIWLYIIITAIAGIVHCFTVTEYYPLGKAGTFWFEVVGDGLLNVWLAMAIMHLKSWARKSWIVMTGLFMLMTFMGGVTVFAVVELAVCLYCSYLFFNKEVVLAFLSDAQSKGSRAVVNRHHCIAYWAAVGLLIVSVVIFSGFHYGTEEWDIDCTQAILDGSTSAREDMIQYLCATYEAQGFEDPMEDVTEYVDDFIRDNQNQYNGNNKSANSTNSSRAPRLNSDAVKAGAKLAGGGLKLVVFVIGSIIAGIFSLCGKFISKHKQE